MFNISAWHNDPVNGTHQTKILSAKTKEKALRDFAKLLTLPPIMRSFTARNKVFMWSAEQGHICDLPAIEG